MASTPSASALSAVLRCRGNIWTRNPPTKRPAASVYSLGLAGGAARDSQAERTRSKRASAWEAFIRGERVLVGSRVTVAYECKEGKVTRRNYSGEINKLCHPKLSQSRGDAHSAVRNGHRALVRQLAHRLTSKPAWVDRITLMIKHTTCAWACKQLFVEETSESPAGTLRVRVTPPRVMEHVGRIPSLVLSGWSALRSTGLSLAALVSELVFLKLVVVFIGVAQNLPSQRDERKNVTQQGNGQTHSPTDLSPTGDNSGQRITEDRPD